MKHSVRFAVISLLLIGSLNQPAWADDDDDDPQKMSEISKAFGLIAYEDAQTKALAAKPGVVKEIELDRRKFGAGWDYEVDIVDSQGAEWEVMVDAKTGKVSSVSRDWF